MLHDESSGVNTFCLKLFVNVALYTGRQTNNNKTKVGEAREKDRLAVGYIGIYRRKTLVKAVSEREPSADTDTDRQTDIHT